MALSKLSDQKTNLRNRDLNCLHHSLLCRGRSRKLHNLRLHLYGYLLASGQCYQLLSPLGSSSGQPNLLRLKLPSLRLLSGSKLLKPAKNIFT